VTFLIDANGEIQAVFRGETDLEKIEARIKLFLPRR